MSAEWVGPTPQEILQSMFQAGETSEQVTYGLGLVNEGIKEGEIRTEISCWDNVKGFFEMADRFYVKNEGMALTDAELGIHTAQCESPICKKTGKAYFDVLRPSDEADSAKISKYLQKFAMEMMLGEPKPDLEGKESMFYDSQTGADLFEVKVVDITDKCTVDKKRDREIWRQIQSKREVLLAYIPFSGGIICDIKENYGGSSTSQAVSINERFSPDDEILRHRSRVIGIDPELFYAIIVANIPQTKLLK